MPHSTNKTTEVHKDNVTVGVNFLSEHHYHKLVTSQSQYYNVSVLNIHRAVGTNAKLTIQGFFVKVHCKFGMISRTF
jgi:paraquat-inducible protein B